MIFQQKLAIFPPFIFVFVLMGWSLLPNVLRPFKIYCTLPTIISQLVLSLWQIVEIDPLGHVRVVELQKCDPILLHKLHWQSDVLTKVCCRCVSESCSEPPTGRTFSRQPGLIPVNALLQLQLDLPPCPIDEPLLYLPSSTFISFPTKNSIIIIKGKSGKMN